DWSGRPNRRHRSTTSTDPSLSPRNRTPIHPKRWRTLMTTLSAGQDSTEPVLATQFDDLEQQHETATLGMWIFLATEVMFFGGLIAAYAIYRALSPREFAWASRHLNVLLGCVNTVVLLASSLTMALAVRAAQLRRRREAVGFLLLTLILGAEFL